MRAPAAQPPPQRRAMAPPWRAVTAAGSDPRRRESRKAGALAPELTIISPWKMADFELQHKRHKHPENPIRTVLPRLLDQYKLVGKTPGKTDPGDAAVEELARTIYNGPPERSAAARIWRSPPISKAR